MNQFLRVPLILALKEFRDGLRDRWVAAATILLAILALSLMALGSLPTGSTGVDALAVSVVSLSSLTIYLIPLIALLLSYDAIVGETENGTMLLLLAYPVSRWQVVAGKYLGHLAILAFATIVGYGSAGLTLVFTDSQIAAESWVAFSGMVGSSILLGATFVGIGYLISVLVSERSMAAGVAVAVWLFFVLLYDLGVLGLLVADKGQQIGGEFVQYLLMLNPADIYRLFNLTGFENVRQFSGMAGISGDSLVGPVGLLMLLAGWAVVPLILSAALFKRKEL